MRSCLELAVLAAKSHMPVRIPGRVGTGQTLLARHLRGAAPE
jgi:hypothetical protein